MKPRAQTQTLKQQMAGVAVGRWLAAASLAAEPATEPASPPAAASTDARQQLLLDLEKEWTAAEDKRDAAALRHIPDDRFAATSGAAR